MYLYKSWAWFSVTIGNFVAIFLFIVHLEMSICYYYYFLNISLVLLYTRLYKSQGLKQASILANIIIILKIILLLFFSPLG